MLKYINMEASYWVKKNNRQVLLWQSALLVAFGGGSLSTNDSKCKCTGISTSKLNNIKIFCSGNIIIIFMIVVIVCEEKFQPLH